MEAIKRLLGIATARQTPHDARRIRAAMEQQGWRYGTYRLYVPSRGTRRPVRGFLRGEGRGGELEFGVIDDQAGKPRVVHIDHNGEVQEITKGADTEDEKEIPF